MLTEAKEGLIAAVLEHYGADLSHVPGHGWRSVRCPFHDDRHASARVSLDRGGFACLACGVRGDAISIIRTREGLEYRDALERLETLSGQSFGEIPSSAQRPRQRSRWRTTLFGESRDS